MQVEEIYKEFCNLNDGNVAIISTSGRRVGMSRAIERAVSYYAKQKRYRIVLITMEASSYLKTVARIWKGFLSIIPFAALDSRSLVIEGDLLFVDDWNLLTGHHLFEIKVKSFLCHTGNAEQDWDRVISLGTTSSSTELKSDQIHIFGVEQVNLPAFGKPIAPLKQVELNFAGIKRAHE